MKKKYLLFDFDGVLAESVDIKTEAFREMYLPYGELFAQKVVDFHEANGGVSRYEKFKIFNGEWLGEEITPKKIDDLANIFSDLVVDGVVNADEVKGTKEFLETSSQYIKFIITGTPTIEIKPILKKRGMDHYFKKAFGSPEKKGFGVKHILKTGNIKPKECVFIGDALADYNAAKDNNIDFILRETPIAMPLFKDYNGYSLKDMTNMHAILKSMNE